MGTFEKNGKNKERTTATSQNQFSDFEKFVGESIKLHRLSALLTQDQLADRISSTTGDATRQSDVSKYEMGNVSLRTLFRVAQALRMQPSDLVRTAEFKMENSGKSEEGYMEQLRDALVHQVSKLIGKGTGDRQQDKDLLCLETTHLPK